MTDLGQKTVRRRVTTLRGETLVVSLTPEGVRIREPRRKGGGFLLPYGHAYVHAVELHVAAKRRERDAARKVKRAARRKN